MRPRELNYLMQSQGLRQWGVIGFIATCFVVSIALPTLAHADLVSVTPGDGTVASEPIEQFTLVFTAAVEPVNDGARLLSGRELLDVTVFQPSDATVIIEPVEPLTDGRYALFWKVQSADAHVIEGTVVVEVASPTTTTQGDTAAAGSDPDPGGTAADAAPPTTIGVTTTTLPMVNTSLPPRAYTTVRASVEDSASDAVAGEWIARVGRWILMIGGLIAIGAFVFAGTSLVGSQAEVRRAVSWVRRGGILVLVGTLVEVLGASTMLEGSLSGALSPSTLVDVLAGTFGVAVLLRLAGGIILLQDPRLAAAVPLNGPSLVQGESQGETIDAAQGAAVAVTDAPAARYHLDMRQEWTIIAGILAVAASFTFDGHTTSVDPSVVARASSFVHVLAGGVWFGGLVVMADTLTRRWRSGAPLDAAAMTVRFSRSAVGALIVVALAGLALTWTIVESISDLVSTSWGRLLLVKVGLVASAAVMGGYNHFKVMPRLDQDSVDEATSDQLRRIVMIEALVLAGAVAISAVLVGAAV